MVISKRQQSSRYELILNIPLFEGKIDEKYLDRWLRREECYLFFYNFSINENMIYAKYMDRWLCQEECYIFVYNFSINGNIIFALLKSLPYVKKWRDTYSMKNSRDDSREYKVEPLGAFH